MQQQENGELTQGYKIITGPITGGNGEIFICQKNEKKYAIKTFKKNIEQFIHETSLLSQLRQHNNIVKMIETLEINQNKAIVLEYCSQNLKNYLQDNPTLNEQQKLRLFAQIASAFKSIFFDLKDTELTFQHRDIKPENLMIGEDNQLKIIDFGSSRLYDGDLKVPTMKSELCGTPGYMDPLMEFGGEGFTGKSDIWSMGGTLYFILSGQCLPIQPRTINQQAMKVPQQQRKKFKLNKIQEIVTIAIDDLQCHTETKQLLKNMMTVELANRYGWDDLFNDPLMQRSMEEFNSGDDTSSAYRRKPKKISQLSNDFVSMTFKERAGSFLTETYYNIISKGQHCVLAAQKMMTFFNDQKPKEEYMKNWQIFEKCNYLLHLQSLITLNSYNQILVAKQGTYGRETINEQLLKDLEKNVEILDRIQLQVYYLFENVRRSMQGNGLEQRIRILTSFSQDNEYEEKLVYENEQEERYFQYQKNDMQNVLNRPETFDDEKFYNILSQYIKKVIKILINIPNLEDGGILIISDLIVALDVEGFYRNASMSKIQSYLTNKQTWNKQLLLAKLKVIINSSGLI